MKKALAILPALLFALSAFGQANAPFRPVQTIALPNVDGFLDHMGVDIKGQRLFVPTEIQKTVEVIDLRSGKVIHTITGLQNPHTVLYRASLNEIFVSDAVLGACLVFRGDTYEHIKTIPLGPGADNAAYDPVSQDFYIDLRGKFTHSPDSRLAIVDTRTATLAGEITIPGANIQAMAFDPAGPRMYIDVADRGEVAVIDRAKRAIVATWPVPEGPWPYAIALDSADHRLFVASRIGEKYFRLGKLLVLDSETGRLITTVEIAGGADEAFYDATRRRNYIPGGDGFVDVIQQLDPDHYRPLARVPTGVMAKTGLFVPELSRFYAAVPERRVFVNPLKVPKVEPGEVQVFSVAP